MADGTTTPAGFFRNDNGNLQKIPHTQLSKHSCIKCGKGIKERLIRIKAAIPRFCYRHWKTAKGQ